MDAVARRGGEAERPDEARREEDARLGEDSRREDDARLGEDSRREDDARLGEDSGGDDAEGSLGVDLRRGILSLTRGSTLGCGAERNGL
jgi:hypothetical protein